MTIAFRLLLAWLSVAGLAEATAQPRERPNIVLIVADDVGFTDLGAYGSEIATPTIDALARRGVLFANFHATPMCAPSRAMLMTGIDSHAAGIGNLPETTPEEHRGSPAYLGRLRPGIRTIGERLQAAGYRTYMTGKWHLGHTPDTLPSARGFDRSFILDSTGADNWEHRPYLPYYDRAEWYEDGEAAHELPEDFYSSEFLVDRMIRYIDSEPDGRPFFAYVGFQAIHMPVQAPRAFTDRYAGRYAAGWQALREERHRAAIARGLFPEGAALRPMRPEMRRWESLSAEERAWYAEAMAVNAGMLEAMDHHLGRLIDHLRRTGRYENTIFVVTSDNGPEGALPTASLSMRLWMRLVGYSTDRETLGERGSFAFIGPEWASAAASPHDLFKFYAGEGGTRVPLVVAGPGIRPGRIARQLSLISDIPATLAAIGGADSAGMTGRTLLPLLSGDERDIYGPGDGFGIETAGRMAYFRGRYKITRNGPPLGDKRWRLYDIVADPGETRDLSARYPERFRAMQAAYARWAERNGVLDMPAGYDPIDTLTAYSRAKLRTRYRWAYALIVLLGVSLVALPVWLVVRARRRRP